MICRVERMKNVKSPGRIDNTKENKQLVFPISGIDYLTLTKYKTTMKTRKQLFILILLALFILTGSSCHVIYPQHHSKQQVHTNAKGDIPPGQKKKMTGEKSAKKYAPGQEKKH